jgi:hypothetical protein
MKKQRIFFNGMADAACALMALSDGRKYITRNGVRAGIQEVCREAAATALIYLMDWCLERNARGEDETSAVIAYGLEGEVREAIDSLEAIAMRRPANVREDCLKAGFLYGKLIVLHSNEVSLYQRREVEQNGKRQTVLLNAPKA